jgi:hypothetical protein
MTIIVTPPEEEHQPGGVGETRFTKQLCLLCRRLIVSNSGASDRAASFNFLHLDCQEGLGQGNPPISKKDLAAKFLALLDLPPCGGFKKACRPSSSNMYILKSNTYYTHNMGYNTVI